MSQEPNRRDFLSSLTALALIESLSSHNLFGADVSPMLTDWYKQLYQISRDVADHKTKDLEFQSALEGLYARVNLEDLLKTLDFDKLSKQVDYPAKGAKSLTVDFKVGGLPTNLVFGRQVFAMTKGRSVVPHGHNNMATGFIVLKGDFRGRHYDRVEDHKDHYIVKPTIDRTFKPGEFSTVSDHKDNVHWFTAESETGFIFNVHVNNTDPTNQNGPGRVYVDPMGEKLSGGLIKAPKVSYGRVNQLYG